MTEGIIGIIGALIGGIFAWLLQELKFKQEKAQSKNKAEENVKQLLTEILSHRNHVERSFETLKKRVAGFDDKELQMLLMAMGARKREREDHSEWWYLASRSDELFAKRTD